MLCSIPQTKTFLIINSFLCLILIVFSAHAEKLPFKSYTTADGLAHDWVNQIVRDSHGFLWFCTGEGLSRFDGYEFKNYTQADGLPHRGINDLLEIDDGTYLVATNDGFAVFNPLGTSQNPQSWNPNLKSGPPMFQTFIPSDTKPDKKSAIIKDLQKTRDGQIWAATMDGFYRLAKGANGDWQFNRINYDLWQQERRLLEFYSIYEDSRGWLWLTTPQGILRYEPQTGKITTLLEKNGTQSILEDSHGRMWIGGGSGTSLGITLIDSPAEEHPIPLKNYTFKDGSASGEWINDQIETHDGRILIGTPHGLYELLPDSKPSFRVVVADVDIVSLEEDKDGNIWIGTATLGVIKLVRHGFVVYGQTDGVPPLQMSSIITGNNEEIFVTSGNFDLLHFDGTKFFAVKPLEMASRSWGWSQIDFRSRFDGDWWITTNKGVFRYPSINKFENLAHTKPKRIYDGRDGIYTEEVFRLFEDSRGNVWIYTFGKPGDEDSFLYLWERATDRVHRFGVADGLPFGNNVTAFSETLSGDIWLGFYVGGVARFHNGKFRFYSVQTGFPTGFINAAYTDKAGRVWFATGNSGVVRLDNPDADEPQFTNLTVNNGLSSNQATCLTEDNFGRIYIGTGRGITRLEPETGRTRIFTQADGLPFSSVRSCGRDSTGNLWFIQKTVLVRMIPEADKPTAPPPIFIGDLQVNGERVRKLSELGERLVENLDLASDQRQIQIDFFALAFGTGENLRYQYKLDNAEWGEPTTQRNINLNLSPGNYNFQVRAVNAAGLTSEKPAIISFSIARPIWQRWWFLLLAALTIGTTIYTIYRYRLKRLLELEKVRTRIATDLHDDIGSSLSQIAILSEVVRQKVGNNGANEPLNLIADTSREMVDSMSDIVWAINPNKDSLSDLAKRMRRFASDVLEAKDIAFQFEFSDSSKDISLGADIRREVYLMFKECVNNLAKHSKATGAVLSLWVEGNNLLVKIKDNGKGFHVPPFDEHTTFEGFGGNGLLNLRKRTENLNGKFEIHSEIGKGTEISLEIPIPDKKWISFR